MIDNRDLRLLNLKEEDKIFYNHQIFIVAWQRAKSLDELSRRLKTDKRLLTKKAQNLRRRGILLKRFKNLESFPIKMISELRRIAAKEFKASEALRVNGAEFISFWGKAKNIQEVCDRFNQTRKQVVSRAGKYRYIHKVPLKRFRPIRGPGK